jgi:ankyrin repeat protein
MTEPNRQASSPAAALFQAIQKGEAEDVRERVAEHPELLTQRDADGASPMQLALYIDRMEIVSVLLEIGYRPDVFESVLLGRADYVRDQLHRHPEQKDAFSPDGWSLLHLAAYGGEERTVRAVLEAGAALHPLAKSKYSPGNTPLHAAIAAGKVNAALLLIDAGADVNFPQQPGAITPLHVAASRADPRLTDFLIQQGARINARTTDGRTPLAVARDHKNKEVENVLLRHGGLV